MQRRIDSICHPVQRSVMRHMTNAGHQKQLAFRQLVVQPDGLRLRVNHPVIFSRNQRTGQFEFVVAF